MQARRDRWGWIHVDEHDRDNWWSFADPMTASDGTCRGTLDYLLRICPTTTDAKAKLAAMRRALELVAGETPQNPPDASKGGKERERG